MHFTWLSNDSPFDFDVTHKACKSNILEKVHAGLDSTVHCTVNEDTNSNHLVSIGIFAVHRTAS